MKLDGHNFLAVKHGPSINWAAVVSGALLAHFVVSVGVWLLFLILVISRPDMWSILATLLWQSVPAFGLFAMSAVVLVFSLRHHRSASRWAAVLVVATIAAFFVDVHFGRWQFQTDIATKEYWDAGGREHDYFTWWWYNDRWFH